MKHSSAKRGAGSAFADAARGLVVLIKTQRNARIHLLAAAVVAIAGVCCRLTAGEWCLVVFACAGVLAAEALNTAVELLGDAVTLERHALIGKAKDVAAGAVLIAAAGAVIVGVLVFAPHVF